MPLVAASGSLDYEALDNAQPQPELRAGTRLDPYYERLWEGGSQVPWGNIADLRAQSEAGLVKVPAHLRMDEEQVARVFASPSLRYDRLTSLAVLDSWRTQTTQTMAALTGSTRFLDPAYRVMSALFAAGLTEVGTFQSPFGVTRSEHSSAADLYRSAKGTAFTTKIADGLTETERLWVTGGYPYTSGGTFDRHNLLAAELCLRVGEFCPNVGTLLGEKHALYDMLTTPMSEDVPPQPITYDSNQRRADAVIVRADGARIALEMTANPSNSIEQKVTRWCERIESTTLSDTGLFVLFVSAVNTQTRTGGSAVDQAVHTTISRIARRYSKQTQARIGWVQWRQWFPERGRLSPEFLSLTAATPTGGPDDRWEPVRLLDPTSFTFAPHSPRMARAVIRASTLLGSTPAFIRDRLRTLEPPAVRLLDSAPVAEPLRPDRPRQVTPFGHLAETGEPMNLPPGLALPERV